MCHFLKSTIGALFPLPIISICHFILGLFFLAPYSPMPIFQATMESMTMKGFSMLLQTVFWGCFINSIHNMSYYMEVSSCPTLPLSWVSKGPVSSCPVSSCPGFVPVHIGVKALPPGLLTGTLSGPCPVWPPLSKMLQGSKLSLFHSDIQDQESCPRC